MATVGVKGLMFYCSVRPGACGISACNRQTVTITIRNHHMSLTYASVNHTQIAQINYLNQ